MSGRSVPEQVGESWLDGLVEIHRLLDEAYRHLWECGDCNCGKSSEGAIEVYFGHVWDRLDQPEPMKPRGVMVYSYLLGPSRSHHFGSVKEALETVRRWHTDEMETDHSQCMEPWDGPGVFSKHPHRRGCTGALYGTRNAVHTDRRGRVGNGGMVTQEFRCNCHWDGCKARVLVAQWAILDLARSVEVRPTPIDRGDS